MTRVVYHPDGVDRLLGMSSITQPWWPRTLSIHPTDRCNHACQWCWFERTSREIDVARVREMLTTFAMHGLSEVIVSGGGEPLLHPEIRKLAAELSDRPRLSRRLYTNGSHSSRLSDIAEAFDYIRVSVDAGTAPVYAALHGTTERAFADLLDTLESIVRASPNTEIGLSAVVIEENVSSLQELLDRAVGAGIRRVFLKPRLDGMHSSTLPSLQHLKIPSGLDVHFRSEDEIQLSCGDAAGCSASHAATSLSLLADNGLYPCCHLASRRYRIAMSFDDLRSVIGTPQHIEVLESYARLPHPCFQHNSWKARVCHGAN